MSDAQFPIDNNIAVPLFDLSTLSTQQQNVLQLIAAGQQESEIAATLGIKTKTVKFHKTRLYKALGVKNSLKAAHIYQRAKVESYINSQFIDSSTGSSVENVSSAVKIYNDISNSSNSSDSNNINDMPKNDSFENLKKAFQKNRIELAATLQQIEELKSNLKKVTEKCDDLIKLNTRGGYILPMGNTRSTLNESAYKRSSINLITNGKNY